MARQPHTADDLIELASTLEIEAARLRGAALAMQDSELKTAWIHADSLRGTYLRQVQAAVIKIVNDVRIEVDTAESGLPSPFAAAARKAKRQSRKG